MSRWTTPRSWACWRAPASSAVIRAVWLKSGAGPGSRSSSESVTPSMNSLTMNGVPSTSPTSKIGTIEACRNWPAAWASRRKFSRSAGDPRLPILGTFRATIRSIWGSRAL